MRQRTRQQRATFLQIMTEDGTGKPSNNEAGTHEMQMINWVPLRLKFMQPEINTNLDEEILAFEPTHENIELNLFEIIGEKANNKDTSKLDDKLEINADETEHCVQINATEGTLQRELQKRITFAFIHESEDSDI
ncbi:hypothetical protein EVAR_66987_1 [Eumeta japonica]|uniref:Uncharacterized protein n=1 Tax=Eumeta variegata TaxID=151549 RepID=A0A4C1ZTQ0_EUMVA|nr:hypothetical protein EVAR_66987_1 [Eumeta japonica]